MTESRQQAFEAASKLPLTDQDAMARWIMAELESDSRWSALFSGSQDTLASLANEAVE